MKPTFALALLVSLLLLPLGPKKGQSSIKIQHSANKINPAIGSGGVEAIMPQETPPKEADGAAGWSGNYVGVNAGMGRGATAGTNVVLPFGTGATAEK